MNIKTIRTLVWILLLALGIAAFSACDGRDDIKEPDPAQTSEGIEGSMTESSTEAVSKEETTVENETENLVKKPHWSDDGVFKLLCLGNSFSVDSLEYLYPILQELGIEKIKLGNLAIGGCSVATHYKNARSDAADYYYYSNIDGSWKEETDYKISDILNGENWDFISIQQASHDSGMKSSYGKLTGLLDIIEEKCPTATFVWNMTWAYQGDANHEAFPRYNKDQMTMYTMIVGAVQEKVMTDPRIELVLPTGTAIQNARASWLGDTLTRDGFHLSIPCGRYIAALTFAAALTGKSVENLTYKPAGLSNDQKVLAQEVVMLAIQTPFAVSVPTTPEPEPIDWDALYELPLTFNRGYWHACGSPGTEFNLNVGSELANKFYSTQVFDKDDLPAGSVIILEKGWQFRPESWINRSVIPSSLRPGMVSQNMIVIDESWWGDFTERAFNICKNPQVSLLDLDAEDMKAIFKIYVPYDPAEDK